MAEGDIHKRHYYLEPYTTITVVDKIPLAGCQGEVEFLEEEREITLEHPDTFGLRNLQGYGIFKARLKVLYINSQPVLKPNGRAYMNLSIMPPNGMKFYFTGFPDTIYKLSAFDWSSDFGFYFVRADGERITADEIAQYQKVKTIYIINGLSR